MEEVIQDKVMTCMVRYKEDVAWTILWSSYQVTLQPKLGT